MKDISSFSVVKVEVLKDGPIKIEGDIDLLYNDKLVEKDVCYLCRCGQSTNKPFCDGTHKIIDFKD